MLSTRRDEACNYAVADRLLALRERARLTQRELATLLAMGERAIQAWEAGLSYPATAHLQHLIAIYIQRGAFEAAHEEEEAAALWEIVREQASRRITPFDPIWFASLPRTTGGARASSGAVSLARRAPLPPTAGVRREDWGDAPALPVVQGREAELATLTRWVCDERCRLVEVLGMGGIGKTTVAARLAHDLAPYFEVVYWRSLRNALSPEDWLAGAIATLSPAPDILPDGLDARIQLLLALLRARRGLLVLDNLESVLAPGAHTVRYRDGYSGYGTLLQRLSESPHEGCLLVTSREQPLRDNYAAVRSLRLAGLDVDAGQALLGWRTLSGDDMAWWTLVMRYTGNPLALTMVGETIAAMFDGNIAAFLAQDAGVFGDIRQLLDDQVARLSALEQALLTWLAVEREPVGIATLVTDLGPAVGQGEVVEALQALQRRSLLEPGARGPGTFTLQPVVLEYATARLVAQVCEEVLVGPPALLVSHALVKARAKDYIRRSQEHLIAQPLLARLGGDTAAVEWRLLDLLDAWRDRPRTEQGYGPGNVVNLLRLLRGDLRGLDLSRLVIRHAYLQGSVAQDASLADAHLVETVLTETFTYPMSMTLTTGGDFLVVGTNTGEVRLWRVADRTLLLSMQGHSGSVVAVAVSADGRLVVSGSHESMVRLWAAPSGEPLAVLQGHTAGIGCVAISADGRLVVSGSHDGTVRLWAAPSGEPLAVIHGHRGSVAAVAVSGDARLLASSSYDGTVRLWAVPSGESVAVLQGHSSAVGSVAVTTDGRLVVSGSLDGTVRLWEASSGKSLAVLQGHSGAIGSVAVTADGRLVASSSLDETVRLWEAPSGKSLAVLQGHSRGVMGVALSGDGRLVVSGSLDGTVRLWEAPSGEPLAALQGHSARILAVALSGNGRLLASGRYDGTVSLWEAPSGEPLAELQGPTGGILGLAVSEDGQLVASGSQDGTVRLWAAPSGKPLAILHGHSGGVLGVALSGDAQLLASGSFDGTVRLWDAPSGKPLAILHGHKGVVRAVAMRIDGRLVASGSYDGTVRLWDAPSGVPLAVLQGHSAVVRAVAVSGNGRLVVSGSLDGTVRLWAALQCREATPSGQPIATLRGHSEGVGAVAVSSDGRLVVSGSYDGTVRLWEAPSGRPIALLQGHNEGVGAVAVAGDGRFVVSGSLDGTVRLWETGSGAVLRTLRAERPYERLNITGLTGVTEAQRRALVGLGAVERHDQSRHYLMPQREPVRVRLSAVPQADSDRVTFDRASV